MKTMLYRYFDKKDQLLYIGITGDNVKRQSQHKKHSFWAGDIHRATFEYFDTRKDALVAEKQAIINEKPLHNKQHSNSLINDFDMSEALAKLHLVSVMHGLDIHKNPIELDSDHQQLQDYLQSLNYSNEEFGWSYDECLVWELYVAQIEVKRGKLDLPSYQSCHDCINLIESNWYSSLLESATTKLKIAREVK